MAEAQSGGMAFQAVNAVGSGYVQADALNAQADYEKKIAELNNKTLDYQVGVTDAQAADAVNRGGQAANQRVQKTRLQVGAQRAAMGAGAGGTISPDVVNETQAIGAADVAAIKTNAWREAYGFKSKGIQIQGEQLANTFGARTRANALEYAARSSMITGWNEGIVYGAQAASGGKGGKK